MTTHQEIHDRIQFFRKYSYDQTELSEILEALNDKLAALEHDNHELKMQLDELNQTHE